tara:strand:- start:2812 stop:3414 length:603 start_codon:yes stop_codon:yes gene_type:complete
MKLLREYFELCDGGVCQDLLTEDEKRRVANGTIILSGVMQMSETKNHNGRMYPHALLEREVGRYKQLVKERRALGELDHPESSVINLQNCSHLVTDIWMEGKKVMGKIEVLSTPAGKILRNLVECNIPCGISSRGMGSVTERDGATIVEDDFQLICFDMVSDPSTPGAIMSQVNESKDMTRPLSKLDRVNRLMTDILRNK